MFNIPIALVGDITEEDDLLGLQPGQHFPVAVDEQLAAVLVLHGANRGNGDSTALGLPIKAP